MLLSWSLTTLPGRSRRGLNLRVCCESHLSSATIPHCSPVYQNHLSTKVTCLLSRHSMLGEPEKCWVLSENCLTDGMWQKTEKSWACCKSNVSIAVIPIIFIMMVSLDCRQVTQCSFFGLQKLFRRRNIALKIFRHFMFSYTWHFIFLAALAQHWVCFCWTNSLCQWNTE